ncbi:MAG: hypothetical protein MUO82_04630, partial [Candidatus Thermoplasmatota archaeon]|nr:hypothetical protein [Candidatus Thermoplasmatota archaeon]
MRKKIGIWLVCMMLVTSILVVFPIENVKAVGKTYYISTTGSDSNSGTFSSPWKTLESAMTRVSSGDTVYLMAGVYYDKVVTTWGANSGTLGNWITYTAYGNGEVILDATGSTNGWSGVLWLDGLEYIRFSKITFRNSANFGILCESAAGKTSNIIIDNCTFYSCSEAAMVFLSGGTHSMRNIIIENNTIYNVMNGWADASPGQECISLCNIGDFVVKDNYLYNYRKVGIDAKSGCFRGKIHHNRLNTLGAVPGFASGIYVDGGNTYCNNISIYCNVVWGNGPGYITSTEKGGTLSDIKVYNNIYYGTLNGFQINGFTSTGSHLKKNLMFISNTVGGNTNICFQITEDNANIKNLTIRNNIFNGKCGINIGSDLNLDYHHVDHNLFNVLRSEYYGDDYIDANPLFVDQNNNNFNLKSSSPCINAGNNLYAPTTDFWGNRRVGTVDIGAIKYLSVSDTTPPTPNPSSWATLPYDASSTSISMLATTATDSSGGIQYYFDETSGN